jgi:8-oxo-dGTP pyrophosphatase MutT (NUDIX family)
MFTVDEIRRRLHQPLPGLPAQLRMAPPDRPGNTPIGVQPRTAGVLLLLYPRQEMLYFVLTRRAEKLGNHSGQISFPGGRVDPTDADVAAAALRETNEELGIACEDIAVVGSLSTLYVPPSNFIVHPVVAHTPIAPVFVPNHDEVAEVIEVPLVTLLDPTIRGASPRALVSQGGKMVMTPHYHIAGHTVWGATAMILSEFEAVLRLTVTE